MSTIHVKQLEFFTCIQFISVFTASANNIFKTFQTSSPPPPPHKKMVRPLINPVHS